MKKRLLITMVLVGLLVSCQSDNDNPDNSGPKTVIVFDNTQGICAVTVFNDSRRRDGDKIDEIPAGTSSREIEWSSGASVPFYFKYHVSLKGINNFSIDYVPDGGKDQTWVRIDPKIKNNIKVPRLEETLSSPDTLLSNNCYIFVQNNSSFPFQLHRGSSPVNPDGSSYSAVINSGERARYTITPGATSNYRLLVGANYVTLPGSLTSFAAGRVYNLVFDGGVYLASEVEIKLANVAVVSSNNQTLQKPGAPVVTASDGFLTVRWTAVKGAESYEVYISTARNPPATPVRTVLSTTTELTDLNNGTTYYVWVKAKNNIGTSDFSPAAYGRPLGTPELPTINSGHKQLFVTWTAVAGADEYEVYYGTDTPTTFSTTTSGTSATITGLTNGTTYYVRLCAKNSGGVSDFGPNASGMAGLSPGLYRGTEKIGNQNLSTALSYISANAVSGDNFFIVLEADESTSPTNLAYSGQTVGITLVGYDVERTITLASDGSMFTIYSDITLTLDENITLVGRSTNNASLVYLNSGNLVINVGAKISGNIASSYGGGIYIGSSGAVTMYGGTISGNTSSGTSYSSSGGGGIYIGSNGTFTMYGGTISGNTSSGGYSSSGGGGIYVGSNGTFTMYGGTISGNTATINNNTASGGGGIYVSGTFKKLPSGYGQNSGIIYGNEQPSVDGTPLKNTVGNSNGHAVYYYSSSSQFRRDTTAGQTDHIDTTTRRGLSTSGNPPYGQ